MNVAVADNSRNLDTSCLIKNGIQSYSKDGIVIYGIANGAFTFPGTEPDYLVVFQDWNDCGVSEIFGVIIGFGAFKIPDQPAD